ncbi:MAG TPA: hypothetical protein ENJ22_03275 [Gammaproteobacteria bacterium]|nr:hypothetical protein [Gammaproteobacteria bacterium]
MKTLFIVLVAINAIFFAWQMSYDGKAETDTVMKGQLDSEAPTLLLLSERERLSGPTQNSIREGKKAPATLPVKKPAASAPEPGPAKVPERLQTGNAVASTCYRIGPFEDRRQVEELAASHQLAATETSIEEEQEKRHAGYWVKWPEELSLSGARSVMNELRNRGVTDMSISPLDNKRYALSLGIFGTRYYMEQRVDEMRALGYHPVVEDRYKEATVYWLRVGKADKKTSESLRVLIGQNQGVTMLPLDCR